MRLLTRSGRADEAARVAATFLQGAPDAAAARRELEHAARELAVD
jgi:hypothetical protein